MIGQCGPQFFFVLFDFDKNFSFLNIGLISLFDFDHFFAIYAVRMLVFDETCHYIAGEIACLLF